MITHAQSIAPVYKKYIKAALQDPLVNMVMIETYQPGGYFAAACRYITQYTREAMQECLDDCYSVLPTHVLGLASLVNIKRKAHLLLLDFDAGKNDVVRGPALVQQTHDAAQDIWLEYGLPGTFILVRSSKSGIHVLGTELIDWTTYSRILQGGCVGVDQLYCQWSLARGYGTLRMTRGGNKTYRPRAITGVNYNGST